MDKNPSTATVKTPSANFTGDVWMNPVFGGDGTILDASGDGEATTWLEPFTDEQYLAAHRTAGV
jgi:hypothetical protein